MVCVDRRVPAIIHLVKDLCQEAARQEDEDDSQWDLPLGIHCLT